MFSNADEASKFIQDEGVQFVDVRFCDLPGVMQHFNVPAEGGVPMMTPAKRRSGDPSALA